MRTPRSIATEVARAPNIVLVSFNILAFVILSIFWVWYLGTQEVYNIVSEKAISINNIAKEEPSFAKIIDDYIAKVKSDTANIEYVSNKIKQRNVENVNTFQTYLIPPMAILGFFFILSLVYLWYSGERWGLIENILVLLIILSFTVEIVFYFVIIHKYQYTPNSQIIANILSNAKPILPPLPPLPPLPQVP